MNELAIGQKTAVVISVDTRVLIKTGVSHYTLQTFGSVFYDAV